MWKVKIYQYFYTIKLSKNKDVGNQICNNRSSIPLLIYLDIDFRISFHSKSVYSILKSSIKSRILLCYEY